MTATTLSPSARPRAAQAGFTIVEMMVALAIGLFVVLGFTASFVNMKSTFKNQDGLAQLQDNERLAMTVLTSSVQEAGYYPTGADLNASPPLPVSNVDRSEFVASTDVPGGAMAAGTYIFGTVASGSNPATLSTAYVSKPGDGVLDCQGRVVNASGAADVAVRNIFYVDATTKTFGCETYYNGTQQANYAPLVTNVTALSLLFGVDSSGDGTVDSYKTADVASAYWATGIKSVRVQLTFVDPNATQTGNTAGITWLQTINLMNNR